MILLANFEVDEVVVAFLSFTPPVETNSLEFKRNHHSLTTQLQGPHLLWKGIHNTSVQAEQGDVPQQLLTSGTHILAPTLQPYIHPSHPTIPTHTGKWHINVVR